MSPNHTRLVMRFMLFALQTFAAYVMWDDDLHAVKPMWNATFKASVKIIEDIRTELEQT